MTDQRLSVTKDGMGWCVTLPGTGQPYALVDKNRTRSHPFGRETHPYQCVTVNRNGHVVTLMHGGLLSMMERAIEFVTNYSSEGHTPP